MAIKMEDILMALDEANLRYSLHELTQEPVILFPTENYQNENRRSLLIVVIQLTEDGEYIKFSFLRLIISHGRIAYAVLKSFAIIAWQVKLLDFEVDPGEEKCVQLSTSQLKMVHSQQNRSVAVVRHWLVWSTYFIRT